MSLGIILAMSSISFGTIIVDKIVDSQFPMNKPTLTNKIASTTIFMTVLVTISLTVKEVIKVIH